jgi:toxin ParE1/3/4
MKPGYRLSKSAESDLLEIWDYTAHTWGVNQAEKYLKRLESRFFDLAAEPQKGRPRKDLASDYFSYHEVRHLIFYRPQDEGIAIARILHERMDLGERLLEDPGED